MATLVVDSNKLKLRFQGLEAIGALRREASVPCSDVTRIEVEPAPWPLLRGIRVGTGLPGRLLLGTMHGWGKRDAVALRGQGAAIVVTCREGAPFHRLIATARNPTDAAREAESLRQSVGLA